MSDIHENGMEQENFEQEEESIEEDLIYFEDDEGTEYVYTVEEYFFYNGDEYALLADAEEDTEEEGTGCIICRVEDSEENEDEEIFVPVEDEKLAEKLFEIATMKLKEDEEEDEE